VDSEWLPEEINSLDREAGRLTYALHAARWALTGCPQPAQLTAKGERRTFLNENHPSR